MGQCVHPVMTNAIAKCFLQMSTGQFILIIPSCSNAKAHLCTLNFSMLVYCPSTCKSQEVAVLLWDITSVELCFCLASILATHTRYANQK